MLMCCQTTDTTPKDISSTAEVEKTEREEEKPELVLPRAMVVSKRVLCGDAATILEGVVK